MTGPVRNLDDLSMAGRGCRRSMILLCALRIGGAGYREIVDFPPERRGVGIVRETR